MTLGAATAGQGGASQGQGCLFRRCMLAVLGCVAGSSEHMTWLLGVA
ncbi:hypothetical protein HaLaN_31279, partial [Haematococcus lacustris]